MGQKNLVCLVNSIEARKRKAIPEPKPQIVALHLSAKQIHKMDQLFYREICNDCPANTNAYVRGTPVSVANSGPCENVIYKCVCAVQYYRIPDKYLPKRVKKSK